MSRTHVRRRRLGAALVGVGVIAALAGTAGSAFGNAEGASFVADRRYVVHPGDTLWTIARRQENVDDPRPLVDAIVDANDLHGGALVPGERLVLPASG